MVTLNINGIDVQASKDMTVLEAAAKVGIYIPTLCYHPDLPTFGACRVCMVEADGRLVTACRAPVKDGMVVRTDTERVNRVRRNVVALILANHNQDCQSCVKNNNCKLQEVSSFVGITQEHMERFRRQVPELKKDSSNPVFTRDFSRCILCGICIRTCQEINGAEAIDFGFRGYETSVVTLGNKPLFDSKCESCGECVERCPTGALAIKDYKAPEREVKTICTYCGVGCGIYLGVRGDKVVSVRGDKENHVSRGNLCVKGRFGYSFINHPERLKVPLIKKDGEFQEATWDEALSLVAAKFKEIKDNYGADYLAGLSSARCTNEENYLFQKLFRSLGTNNIDHCARL
jgi:predicted molibdopterin-dependent oxidoreductase YjgC